MSIERPGNKAESLHQPQTFPSAGESLLNAEFSLPIWPPEVQRSEVLREAAHERRALSDTLDNIYSKIPAADMSLEYAYETGLITEVELVSLYTSLSDLLQNDASCARLALYLPFEFLPQKETAYTSPELAAAATHFTQSYMKSWNSLHTSHDVRANFIDGDVLEVSLRTEDLPRVVKAAHLIPKLVEKNLLAISDVFNLIENSKDEILSNSIADTLIVLADMHLLTAEHLAYMEQSNNRLLVNMGRIISMEITDTKVSNALQPNEINWDTIREEFQSDLSAIEQKEWPGATESRTKWLRNEEKQKVVNAFGENLSHEIISGNTTPETIGEHVELNLENPLILGIIAALEKALLSVEKDAASTTYKKFEPLLEDIWLHGSSEQKDALSSMLFRAHQAGHIEQSILDTYGLEAPDLGGPSSKNLDRMGNDVDDIREVTATIESDPQLSKYLYPVSLLFGSRLKGYGARTADIDVAVFVKPGTNFEERDVLQESLHTVFNHEKIQGNVVEFWLEEQGELLVVKDLPYRDSSLGNASWTHILFGAAWNGNTDVIKELHKKLLTPYLHSTDTLIDGRNERNIWLEEMERDALQYRLMHKGYTRFNPPVGGISTEHGNEIDQKSTFWDSGYRRVATKLYASRVFLPQIEK